MGLAVRTSGGLTTAISQDLDNTAGGFAVKAAAGLLYGVTFCNSTGSTVFVKIADATVTIGTTTPKMIWAIPAFTTFTRAYPQGITFATRIQAWAVTTVVDSGSTDPGTNALVATFDYN